LGFYFWWLLSGRFVLEGIVGGVLVGGCKGVGGEGGVSRGVWGKGLFRLGCPGGRDCPAGQVCFVHVAIKRVSESGRCADFANNCAVLGIKRATFNDVGETVYGTLVVCQDRRFHFSVLATETAGRSSRERFGVCQKVEGIDCVVGAAASSIRGAECRCP